jgi:hypothetical protein
MKIKEKIRLYEDGTISWVINGRVTKKFDPFDYPTERFLQKFVIALIWRFCPMKLDRRFKNGGLTFMEFTPKEAKEIVNENYKQP